MRRASILCPQRFGPRFDRASLGMRWQGGRDHHGDDVARVLDDLELQAEGLHLDDRAVEVDELSAAQYAEIELLSRLLASIGRDVRVSTAGPDVQGRLVEVGADWLRVDHPTGGISHVHLRHVVLVAGLADGAVPDGARPITARLSLRSVLRRMVDDQATCTLHLAGGQILQGDVVRVGADFVEVHHAGGRVAVPLIPVIAVQDRP